MEIYEDYIALLLEEVAEYWCKRLPAFFPSVSDAEAFIKAHMEMTGRERIAPCKTVEWHKRTDYYFCGDELNRFINDNLKDKFTNQPPMPKAWAEKPGDKCRHSISDKGFYAADGGSLLLSSFVASSWISLGTSENDTPEKVARLAVSDIEPRLINAVRNNAIRQIEPDGFARVKEGEYIHGGLFLEADIKAWAKSEYPRCQLSEFYAVDETLIELHENKINIYRSCEAFDLEPPQEPHLYVNNLSSSKQNGKKERSGAAKDFIELGVVAYKSEHDSYPEKLSQLLLFAKKASNTVSGYVLIDEGKGNGRRIFFSIAKSHRESATYQGIRDAFNAWKVRISMVEK